MILEVFIIEFIVVVSAVVGLSVLFERVSPKIAGVLSGFPVATAITLFFFGFENGTQFASESAVFNIVGLFGLFAFIYIYYVVSSLVHRFCMVVSTIAATMGFFAVAYVLNMMQFTIITAVVFASLSVFLFIFLFRKIKKIKTGKQADQTLRSLLGRAVFTGSIIVAVTGAAELLGPTWSGLLSSFPTPILPLMLMIHHKYDSLHVHALIKHIPEGAFSIILYSLSVYYFYPLVGIYWGTVIAYAAAIAFIFLLYGLGRARVISRFRESSEIYQ